jgi:hypothetical protein
MRDPRCHFGFKKIQEKESKKKITSTGEISTPSARIA